MMQRLYSVTGLVWNRTEQKKHVIILNIYINIHETCDSYRNLRICENNRNVNFIRISPSHDEQDAGHTPEIKMISSAAAAAAVRSVLAGWLTLSRHVRPCHYSHTSYTHTHTHCRWSWWRAHPATFALPSCLAVWLMSDEVVGCSTVPYVFCRHGEEAGWRCKDPTCSRYVSNTSYVFCARDPIDYISGQKKTPNHSLQSVFQLSLLGKEGFSHRPKLSHDKHLRAQKLIQH